MIGKIVTVLAFVALAQGFDYWDECIKQVTAKGADSIDVPPHDPFILINQSINRTIDFMGFEVQFSLENLIWYNIPWWNVTKYEQTYEGDTYGIFEYDLYWSYFTITGDYGFRGDLGAAGTVEDEGQITIYMKHVDWIGSYNYSKNPEYVNDLTIAWTNKELTVNVTGLGFFEEAFDITLEAAVNLGLDYSNQQNVFGQAFQHQINNKWLNDTERMDGLRQWCSENIVNTTKVELV